MDEHQSAALEGAKSRKSLQLRWSYVDTAMTVFQRYLPWISKRGCFRIRGRVDHSTHDFLATVELSIAIEIPEVVDRNRSKIIQHPDVRNSISVAIVRSIVAELPMEFVEELCGGGLGDEIVDSSPGIGNLTRFVEQVLTGRIEPDRGAPGDSGQGLSRRAVWTSPGDDVASRRRRSRLHPRVVHAWHWINAAPSFGLGDDLPSDCPEELLGEGEEVQLAVVLCVPVTFDPPPRRRHAVDLHRDNS